MVALGDSDTPDRRFRGNDPGGRNDSGNGYNDRMYEIDPTRTDLAYEYRDNPGGPHRPELTLVINRLRLMPMAHRHILICVERGRRWMLARLPAERGAPIERFEDQVFTDYAAASWEVFRRRWQAVTGEELA